MNVTANLARLRTVAATIMVDTCTIVRSTVGPLDEDTGLYLTSTAVIYQGPCRIKPATTATVDAAGIAVDTARPVLELPWSDTPVAQPGDTVTMTSGPMTGTHLDVYAELPGTTAVALRYMCERREVVA